MDFSNINMPFSVNEVIAASIGLLKIITPIVVLGLAFVVANIIAYLVKIAIWTYRDNKMNEGNPRDQYSYFTAVKADVWENKLFDIRQKFRR